MRGSVCCFPFLRLSVRAFAPNQLCPAPVRLCRASMWIQAWAYCFYYRLKFLQIYTTFYTVFLSKRGEREPLPCRKGKNRNLRGRIPPFSPKKRGTVPHGAQENALAAHRKNAPPHLKKRASSALPVGRAEEARTTLQRIGPGRIPGCMGLMRGIAGSLLRPASRHSRKCSWWKMWSAQKQWYPAQREQ